MRQVKWLLSLTIILVLLSAGACSSSSSTTSPAPVTYPPAISDVQTAISDTASGISVNFLATVTETTDTSMVHIVYYLDVIPPTDPGQAAYTDEGTYVLKTSLPEPVTWKNVPPGLHTLSAQLVNSANDMPFDPPVIAENTLNVPSALPTAPEIRHISIMPSLPNPQFVEETPLLVPQLQVQASCIPHNVKLNDDNIGKQNVPGEGHFIYYLDIDPPTDPNRSAVTGSGTCKVTTDDFYVWEDIPPGKHVFSVQIVNNDNTPLNPPVIDQIIITLPAKL